MNKEITKGLSDLELASAVSDIEEWHKTGKLKTLSTVRYISEQLDAPDHLRLGLAENLVVNEAAHRFKKMVGKELRHRSNNHE